MLSAASGSTHRRHFAHTAARNTLLARGRVWFCSARGGRAARRDRHKAYAARCPLHLPRNVIRRDAGRGDKGRGVESRGILCIVPLR